MLQEKNVKCNMQLFFRMQVKEKNNNKRGLLHMQKSKKRER